MSLQEFLDDHGIRHFGAHELLSRTPESRDKTIVPPEHIWPHIIPTLELADEIREIMGAPVHVWSGYRTPEYNDHVGGSPTSEHLRFRALDLHVPDQYARLKAAAASVVDHAFARGLATGFGTYDESRFVHIDVGSEKKHLRRWSG